MTKQQVISGNKLIAIFVTELLGNSTKIIKGRGAQKGMTLMEFRSAEGNYLGQDDIASMQYPTDWNWLMNACQKWDTLRDGNILEQAGYIDLSEELDNAVTLYDKMPVFEQLVKNIRWYNKIKKQLS